MKLKKKLLSIFIMLCLVLTTMFSFASTASAATSVSISLSYSYESIPETTASPTWQIVSGGQVLYKVAVKATVYGGGTGIIGKYLTFNNPNTSTVRYVGTSGSIDYNGNCTAYYEVRGLTSFTCAASINDGTYSGSGSATITPQEACFYDPDFFITCYWTDKEDDHTGAYDTVMPGVPGLYKSGFVSAVKMEGSGYSHLGQYVRYVGNGNYQVGAPVTSSGTTPTAGKTIAVDNYYIPRYNSGSGYLRGTVDVYGGVGKRLAEDSGGGIIGWHIDVYTGLGSGTASGNTYDSTYQWVYYYGNNKY